MSAATAPAHLPHEEVMFQSGDGESWCVVRHDDLQGIQSDPLAQNVPIIAAYGTGRGVGESTTYVQTGATIDPWFGCEGRHWDNEARMLWGEDGSPYNATFKDAHQGIGLFVRQVLVSGNSEAELSDRD